VTPDAIEALRAQVMLGTERVPDSPPPGELVALFSAIDARASDRSPESRAACLLAKLAVLTVARRAWSRPREHAGASRSPAPEDLRPVLSRAGARHLSKMLLHESHAHLLGDWLEAAARVGVRPPARALPSLLSAGAKRPDLRPALLQVIGPRGRWLASHNTEWDFAVAPPVSPALSAPARVAFDPAALDDAPHADRVALLRTWREADPTAARAWLASALSHEHARQRAGLMSALEVSLGPDDEALLEQRLDDRGREVRLLCARLLARLPSSVLVARVEERAAGCLSWSPLPESGGDIVVDLPKQLEDAARRDGIEEQPPRRTGKRAWWLRQMVAVVPPSRWEARWGASPAEIVRAAVRSDFAEALVAALASACATHPNAVWAEALLREKAVHDENLWGQVARSRAEPLLASWLSAATTVGDVMRALAQVQRFDGPWSEKLSRVVASAVRVALEGDALPPASLSDCLRACATRMAPEAHAKLREILLREGGPAVWMPALEQVVETLSFRSAMLHELVTSTHGETQNG
jgi:hypothetical protein